MGLPATRDYYNFIEADSLSLSKLGSFAWLGLALAVVETLVVMKFGHGLFPEPWPTKTVAIWSTVLGVSSVMFIVWCVKFYVIDKQHLKGSAGRRKAE